MPPAAKTKWKGRPRIHDHYLVTTIYKDNEAFGRVYLDKEKAVRFAKRQEKSPVVKKVTVRKIT